MTESKAFIDATCKRCRARIGWFGTALEHPGCPRCGWKPDPETLKADYEEMAKFRALLAELRSSSKPSPTARLEEPTFLPRVPGDYQGAQHGFDCVCAQCREVFFSPTPDALCGTCDYLNSLEGGEGEP